MHRQACAWHVGNNVRVPFIVTWHIFVLTWIQTLTLWTWIQLSEQTSTASLPSSRSLQLPHMAHIHTPSFHSGLITFVVVVVKLSSNWISKLHQTDRSYIIVIVHISAENDNTNSKRIQHALPGYNLSEVYATDQTECKHSSKLFTFLTHLMWLAVHNQKSSQILLNKHRWCDEANLGFVVAVAAHFV